MISGYNTSSKKKKQEYDKEKLCRYVGNFVFLLSAIMLTTAALASIFTAFYEGITLAGFFALLVASLAGIIYLNTGGRLKKQRF